MAASISAGEISPAMVFITAPKKVANRSLSSNLPPDDKMMTVFTLSGCRVASILA